MAAKFVRKDLYMHSCVISSRAMMAMTTMRTSGQFWCRWEVGGWTNTLVPNDTLEEWDLHFGLSCEKLFTSKCSRFSFCIRLVVEHPFIFSHEGVSVGPSCVHWINIFDNNSCRSEPTRPSSTCSFIQGQICRSNWARPHTHKLHV